MWLMLIGLCWCGGSDLFLVVSVVIVVVEFVVLMMVPMTMT